MAKATATWQVANYRDAYGLFACTGILANHESPLRPNRFVTQKIIQGVKDIVAGRQETLQLGNLDVWRDWGWAPEYVEAMHLMVQAKQPRDYVIASGTTRSLREFAAKALMIGNLSPEERLQVASNLLRPLDVGFSAMNPSRIADELNWKARHDLEDIVAKMYREELL